MGQIYLVRHGQASFGAADYDQLSELGAEQSRLLGGWFGNCRQTFSGIVTGSLRRHQQTAASCLSAMPETLRPAADLRVEPGFDEYDHQEVLIRYRPDFADTEAASRVLAEADNPRRAFQQIFSSAMQRWMSGQFDSEYRESWTTFRLRCQHALERVVESAGASQNLLVFTSGGPISAICQRLLGIPDRNAVELNWSMANASVTKLMYQPGRVSLAYLNSIAHLEVSGRAHAITYR